MNLQILKKTTLNFFYNELINDDFIADEVEKDNINALDANSIYNDGFKNDDE